MAEADGRILCDPETGKAYFIDPGAGDISFVTPTPSADGLCNPDARPRQWIAKSMLSKKRLDNLLTPDSRP